MTNILNYRTQLNEDGFLIINTIYTTNEVEKIINYIENLDSNNPIFRKTDDIFAIRQFIKEFSQIKEIVFNENLKEIILNIGGKNCFVIKSIYFDKPEKSNWFVSYHQDLTISVNKKEMIDGFNFWTNKHNQFTVQPTLDILENIFTIRIHLDDTNEENGALKIIEKSHLNSVCRIENMDINMEIETFCNVNSGGIMVMKPLLFHSSMRTTNNKKRRVIHIEFSNKKLPNKINWSEYSKIFN